MEFLKPINEAASFGASIQDPFSEKDEKKAMNKFVVKVNPIKIEGVSGNISDDDIDVHIQFSNGDYIESDYNSMVEIYNKDGQTLFSNKDQSVMGKFWGSTGTVTGDVSLVYKYWKEGKL